VVTVITGENLESIGNSGLKKDAKRYVDIYEKFMDEFRALDLPIATSDYSDEKTALIKELVDLGVKVRNNGRSLLWGDKISGACVDCLKGEASQTFILTLKCNRDCFFCANKNQFDYDEGRKRINDIIDQYNKTCGKVGVLTTTAITGGEPLLYLDKCLDFIRHVKKKAKNTGIRIYTNGDLATREVLEKLSTAGLDEIRFGLKLDDSERLEKALEHLALSVEYIPRAMVEMPVEPGKLEDMKRLADKLDEIGIFGINILEFLFPWVHIEEFKKNGFQISRRPYRILYDYTYAGGVPIAKSETDALELMKYMALNKHRYGAHYCSLENKLTAQVWHHNRKVKKAAIETISENDFFIKIAKAYGDDAVRVRDILEKSGVKAYSYNIPDGVIEFSPKEIYRLRGMDIELGIASLILDREGENICIREVAVHKTDSETFTLDEL
jgi:pyruvate formate-lyase activating enzyme-like uncharacterized protein